jgi:hypothetical protein
MQKTIPGCAFTTLHITFVNNQAGYQASRMSYILLAKATIHDMNKEDQGIRSNSRKKHIVINATQSGITTNNIRLRGNTASEGEFGTSHFDKKRQKKTMNRHFCQVHGF